VQRNIIPTGRPKPSVNIVSHLRSPIPSKLQKFPIPHRRLRRIHFNMATGVKGGSAAAQASGSLRGRVRTAAVQVSGDRGRRGTGGERGHNATTQKRDARGRFKPPTSLLTPTSSVGDTPTNLSCGMYSPDKSSSLSDGPHTQVHPLVRGKQALVRSKHSRSDVR
jgi:hypothetical protein